MTIGGALGSRRKMEGRESVRENGKEGKYVKLLGVEEEWEESKEYM